MYLDISVFLVCDDARVLCVLLQFLSTCVHGKPRSSIFGPQMYFPKRTKLINRRNLKCKCFHSSFQYASQDVCLR